MRDVDPSPMPEVLFLLAKRGNGGQTIQRCPATHAATKDLVHLENKKNPTNNPDDTKIVLPIPPAIVSPVIIFTASFANNDFAFLPALVCMLFRSAGGCGSFSPHLTSQLPSFLIQMPGSHAGVDTRCCWPPGAFPRQPPEIAGSVAQRRHQLLQATLDTHRHTRSLLHKRPRGSRIDTVYTMVPARKIK